MTRPDPEREAQQAQMAAHKARRARLIRQHGEPEGISAEEALGLARAARGDGGPDVAAVDVYASVYRDEAAAAAWAKSNLIHHGHPTLAAVPLPDGRVAGILDLRPALGLAGREAPGGEP